MRYIIAVEVDGKTYYECGDPNGHRFHEISLTTDENMLLSRTKENAEDCAKRLSEIGKVEVVPYIDALNACDGIVPETIFYTLRKPEYSLRIYSEVEGEYDTAWDEHEILNYYIMSINYKKDINSCILWTQAKDYAQVFTKKEWSDAYNKLEDMLVKHNPNFVSLDIMLKEEEVVIIGEGWRRV